MLQYWSHFRYTMIHKWYVFIECCRRGIIWRGITHDISKFRSSEFFPYANYFFNTDGTRKDPMVNYSRQVWAFKKAWCHHQNRNDHHYFYWLTESHNSMSQTFTIENTVMPPIGAIKEMAADMIGASAAQGHPEPRQGARDYYLKRENRIVLHYLARRILEIELGIDRHPEVWKC
jgi:hypothetical protein